MPTGLIYDKSTTVRVMAWCLKAPSHYLSQCWPLSMSPYGVTCPNELICVLCITLDNTSKHHVWWSWIGRKRILCQLPYRHWRLCGLSIRQPRTPLITLRQSQWWSFRHKFVNIASRTTHWAVLRLNKHGHWWQTTIPQHFNKKE